MTTLHIRYIWSASYDMVRDGEDLGHLDLFINLTIFVTGGEFFPSTHLSVVYPSKILSVRHDLRKSVNFDPWGQREIIEDRACEPFRELGIECTRGDMRGGYELEREDVMRRLKMLPHYLMLARALSQTCESYASKDVTEDDVSQHMSKRWTVDEVCNLACWTICYPESCAEALMDLADVSQIRCSWDVVTS